MTKVRKDASHHCLHALSINMPAIYIMWLILELK